MNPRQASDALFAPLAAARGAVGWLAVLGCLLCPPAASGQAWITPQGEGSVSLFHQFVVSDEHLNRQGVATRALGSEGFHTLSVDVSYGLSECIAVDASVAWLATKWNGDAHHRHGPIDTGIYHGAFQDGRVGMRYQLALRPLAISPFVTAGVPTNSYQTRGHSAFGRNLKELQLGVSAGRDFQSRAGLGYLHASASYTFSERVNSVDLDLDHVNGDFEAGLPVSRRLDVRAYGNWQVMRDGLQLGPQTEHIELVPIHDRLARASYLQGGLAATIGVLTDVDLSLSVFATATGRNFHAVRAVVTGLTWKFGGHFKVRRPASLP